MAQLTPLVEHLLRRAGFGATPTERAKYARLSYSDVVDRLLNFDPADADVDAHIGTPGYVGITARGQFSPNQVINDTRQRWIFRMVHSPAPLQEKMALFWHHHFATAYSKINDAIGSTDAARVMDSKPSEDAAGARGQIELFRQKGLGNFRDLLVEVAKDPAMLIWLDGRNNFKNKPQENFGRELMELFTFGVENYVETDVYAAARVFTGWNLALIGQSGTASSYYAFNYNQAQHETTAKTFSFPIYSDGNHTIPARTAASGMQDGLDLINALANHPETARRLARRMWAWFVNEVDPPDQGFVNNISTVYHLSGGDIRTVLRAIFNSSHFKDEKHFYQRYAWPPEYIARSLREVGYLGFSVNDAITPMLNMGLQLYEPPDVNGWELGTGWFSTAGMLARMNFAAALATSQKFALRDAARPYNMMPTTLLGFITDRLSVPDLDPESNNVLLDYIRAGNSWVGSDSQLLTKTAGAVHLLAGSGVYQFI